MLKKFNPRFLIYVDNSISCIYVCFFDNAKDLHTAENLVCSFPDWRIVAPEILLENLDDFLFRWPDHYLFPRMKNNIF